MQFSKKRTPDKPEPKRKAYDEDRNTAINAMLKEAKIFINRLHQERKTNGAISAGGGTGTHICTMIMRELPLGVPKVMVSTVASRNMAEIVSTKDIRWMRWCKKVRVKEFWV